MKNISHIFVFLFVMLILLLTPAKTNATGSGTMSFSPQSGTYQVGKQFSADLVLNGNSDSFNAAQATVVLSPQLKIDSLVLGDCNLGFIKTPTISDPSFVGTILGGSSNKCTVYTLTLSSDTTGTYSTMLENESMKQTGTASEIFGSAYNGSYVISTSVNPLTNLFAQNTAPAPQQNAPVQESSTNQNGYSLKINVLSTSNQPLSGASVSLDSSTVYQQTTDQTGNVDFSHIPPGVHVVTITQNGKQIGKEVITVNGKNPVMVLGIETGKPSNSQVVLLSVGIFLAAVILFLLYLWFRKSLIKKSEQQQGTQNSNSTN